MLGCRHVVPMRADISRVFRQSHLLQRRIKSDGLACAVRGRVDEFVALGVRRKIGHRHQDKDGHNDSDHQ